MMKADVVVIGSGLSGVMAALRASSQQRKVIVVRKAWGGTALSSGAFDIAYEKEGTDELLVHFEKLKSRYPFHPYHKLNFDLMEPAFELLKKMLPFEILGSSKENYLFITQRGGFKRAAYVMAPHFVDFRGLRGTALVLGILPMMSAPKIEAQNIITESIAWHRPEFNLWPSVMAKRLDDPSELKKFSKQIKDKVGGRHFSALLVPPILGLDRFVQVRRELEGELGMPVFETLGSFPSVPGLRLQKGLDFAFQRNGIEIIQGRVCGARLEKKKIFSVSVVDDSSGSPMPETIIEGNVFVLASGKYFSGGIRKENSFRETVFDLPLFYKNECVREQDTRSFLKRKFFKRHPLFQIGVNVNEALQPVTGEPVTAWRASGEPGTGAPGNERARVVYENLYACGTILSGFDPALDESRSGVCLLSGYQVGDKIK